MKAVAVAEALGCIAIAITEALPAHARQRVSNILRTAIADGLIDDADTIRVLECVLDEDTTDAD